MTGAASRWLALAGLACLAAMVLQSPLPAALVAAAPLAALILAGLARLRYWAIASAMVMLPYFSYGAMEILTNPAGRTRASIFSTIVIAIFFAALDSMRRR